MIAFIPAANLLKTYSVKGKFYLLNQNGSLTKCRSLLTIMNTENLKHKKLLVVMLNPGKSRPLASDYKETEVSTSCMNKLRQIPLVDAEPDNTQYQIMRVMFELKFSSAKVINLFDIRETKSGILFDNINNGKINNEFSIFSNIRQIELQNYFTSDMTVILAWGKDRAITNIEKIALEIITSLTDNVFSVQDNDYRIYHASPLKFKDKKRWLETIVEQLKSGNKINLLQT